MILPLLVYFSPMWIVAFYYFVRASNEEILNRSFHWFLQSIAVFIIVLPFLLTLGLFPNLILTGYYVAWIWWTLFVVCIGILRWKRYSKTYSIFLGLIVLFLATEVWEIPTHVLTVAMTPTLEQTVKTFMLSSSYLILIIPLMFEFRKAKSMLWYFLPYMFLFIPIGLGILFLLVPNSSIFQPSGYFTNGFSYRMRIFWEVVFILSVLSFPKVKKVESGDGNT